MRRLAAWVLSATLAVAPILRAPPPAWLAGGLPVAATARVIAELVIAGDAEARAGGGRSSSSSGSSRSSGGYSRPGTSSRTPSFSTSPSPSRTPSSGGYARPSAPTATPYAPPPSAGDQAISRDRSSQALQQQRAAQEAQRRQAQPAPPASGGGWGGSSGSSWWGTDRRTPSYAPPPPAASTWFGRQGWSAPPYAAAGPRSFGVWDGLFLWFMLDHLSRPGYAGFFRSHADDPGVRAWREQADAMAQDNADLRRKLAELDTAKTQGGDTGWVEVPTDIPQAAALAPTGRDRTPQTEGMGWGGTLFAVLLVGGAAALAYMALRRRRQEHQGAASMNPLQSALSMARNAVAPKPYRPDLFRVGMVLTMDLSPFILAAGATKVTPPAASPEGRMTVAAVGTTGTGPAALVRLHLDDRKSLFQLHLDAQGRPDEARYFSLFDEVSPADAHEWGAWLDPAEGMIGWPEFQTRDGKTYARVWSPGQTRVPPQAFEEAIETAGGHETLRLQSMLYAAPTGLPAPAPQAEYILVSAVERAGQAWVELRAGIDINPASLELS